MIRKSEWIIDTRTLMKGMSGRRLPTTWEEWLLAHPRRREQWLMSVIELLLKNKNWAGAYLLIQTYVSACKHSEGSRDHNRTPFDESVHVRAVKHWFWSLVEEYGFVLPEEEIPFNEQDIETRRRTERKAEEAYPFVGGKPKRRYSEAVEFFEQVKADKTYHIRAKVPDTPKPYKSVSRNAERIAAGKKPRGRPPRTLSPVEVETT